MKYWIIMVLFFITRLPGAGQDVDDSLKLGAIYYSGDRYEAAINAWEWIIEQGYEAPELYYNLGNAYFKTNRIAEAIVNYERAKLLDPRNEDVAHNLELAGSFVMDNIEDVPGFFISQWHHALVGLLSSDSWAIFSMISFVLLLVFVSVFLYSGKYLMRKLFFWFSVLLLYITVSSFVFSYHNRKMIRHPGTAIISSPSVTVESSPDESGTDLFQIHEGTKVYIREFVGDWTRIRLSDGKEGWIPKESIIEI